MQRWQSLKKKARRLSTLSPSNTPTSTANVTPTPSVTATQTPTSTATVTPTPTETPTNTPSNTPTSTANVTPTPTGTPTQTPTPTGNSLTLYSVTVGRSTVSESGACDDFNNDGGETLKLTTDTLTEGCTVYETNGTTLVTNEYISNGAKGGDTNGSGVFSFGALCGF